MCPEICANANHRGSVRQGGVEISHHDEVIALGQSGQKVIELGPYGLSIIHSVTGMNILVYMNDVNALVRTMQSDVNQSPRIDDVPGDKIRFAQT